MHHVESFKCKLLSNFIADYEKHIFWFNVSVNNATLSVQIVKSLKNLLEKFNKNT